MSRTREQELIEKFSRAQQSKLDERSGKGRLGWREKDLLELMAWLKEEVGELEDAIAVELPGEMSREAIDVANLAMMVWDKIEMENK